jgi:hypothetical protein
MVNAGLAFLSTIYYGTRESRDPIFQDQEKLCDGLTAGYVLDREECRQAIQRACIACLGLSVSCTDLAIATMTPRSRVRCCVCPLSSLSLASDK